VNINYLEWFEDDIAIIGYLKKVSTQDNYSVYEPSLGLLQIKQENDRMSLLLVHDLCDPICDPQPTDEADEDSIHQRYIIRFIKEWDIFVVASNLSSEVSIVQYDRSPFSLTIMEPDDALKLPIDDDFNESLPTGLAISFNASKEVFAMDTYIPPCPLIVLTSSTGIIQLTSFVHHEKCSFPIRELTKPHLMIKRSSNVSNEMQSISSVLPLESSDSKVVPLPSTSTLFGGGPLSTGTYIYIYTSKYIYMYMYI
jgi:hypothetical protein